MKKKKKVKPIAMGYTCQCIIPKVYNPHFIMFGRDIRDDSDIKWLEKDMKIKAIISLKEKTGRFLYQSQTDTSVWYHKLLKNSNGFIFPIDVNNLLRRSEPQQVEFYVTLAKKIKAKMRKNNYKRIYFHMRAGDTHEAYVALAYWRLCSVDAQVPKNILEWLENNKYYHVARMVVEKQMLQNVWDSAGKNTGFMDTWVKKK